jgi:hypothetical protein
MKTFTEKELAALPGLLMGLLNRLTNLSDSPAKRDKVRDVLDDLHARMVEQLREGSK